MKYKLNETVSNYEDVTYNLLSRQGIENVDEYINAHTLHSPSLISNMTKGMNLLKRKLKQRIGIVVDDDCDGFCASGLLYKFLSDELWITDLFYHIHDGKKHGLDNAVVEFVTENKLDLLIVPDAHCDIELCKVIKEDLGCSILVLDHHGSTEVNPYAVIINPNYMPKQNKYPNTYLSGCAVVWKFVQEYSNNHMPEALDLNAYTDLVALSLVSDVMSMKNTENRTLVNMGIALMNKKTGNEFIVKLIEANNFSIGKYVVPKNLGWSLAPNINALCRIGTVEEKDVMFKAFSEQYTVYPYKKSKNAEEVDEDVYTRAVRLAKNAHARQSKLRDTDIAYLDFLIQEQELYKNKVMIVNAENGVTKGLTGLSAMKLSEKYKRPTLITNPYTHVEEIVDNLEVEVDKDTLTFSQDIEYLSGSGRNFDDSYVDNLKQTLQDTKLFTVADGHNSAMGVSFKKEYLEDITNKLNEEFAECDDYLVKVENEYEPEDVDIYLIKDISDYTKWYAINDIKEPRFLIKDIQFNMSNVELVGKNNNTLKFTINEDEDVWMFMFGLSEDDTLLRLKNCMSEDNITINAIGTFDTYMDGDSVISQFKMIDYEITSQLEAEEDLSNTENWSEDWAMWS